jgi:tetratricopeptide (TPR) repeat protein
LGANISFAQSNQGWLKRNWHNMNARYNGYYHSVELLNQSIKTLEDGHKDNFNQVITLFPYGEPEQGQSVSGNMDEIFKKTSQLIKKHPKSRWIDDAYLLIAESYFFKNDPYAAIETFQYVASQYPDGDLKYDSKVWIIKSFLRQEKLADAEALMGLLKQDQNIPHRLDKEINAIGAEIYILEGKYFQAIPLVEKALSLSKKKSERYRYHFVLGQLQLIQENPQKAKEHFVQAIKMNPPYDLAFQSNLGLVKTIGMQEGGSLKLPRKYLKKMLKDDKNLDYFDQIYYELAKLEILDNNKPQAIEYYQLSARASVKNPDQKATSYLELANIFFEERNYSLSQKYFDSTVMFISEKHPEYDGIKLRHSILTDLIDNLVTAQVQDSLLDFAKLPADEQSRRIDAKIKAEKEEEERRKLEAEMGIAPDPFNSPNRPNNNQQVGGQWYFYNPTAISRGANEFTRKWGSRPHSDFWRIKSLVSAFASEQNKNQEENDTTQKTGDLNYNQQSDIERQKFISNIEKEKRKYYENLPVSEEARKASLFQIETAYFRIGKLYQNNLKEYREAISYYEKIQTRFPNSSYEPEVLFNLYKCHQALGEGVVAEKYARQLDERHPASKFNAVVNNKSVVENVGEEKEVINLYTKAYDAYKSGNYAEVIRIRSQATDKYPGNSLQAKYDYLYALAIGKTKGQEPYLAELEAIVSIYPGTDIANQARYTIDYLNNKNQQKVEQAESAIYTFDPGAQHAFALIMDGGDLAKVKIAFNDYNQSYHKLENLRLSDYTMGEKTVVAVQGFPDKISSEKYYVEFLRNSRFFKDLGILANENFMISTDNLKLLLKASNTDGYSRFFVENYIE